MPPRLCHHTLPLDAPGRKAIADACADRPLLVTFSPRKFEGDRHARCRSVASSVVLLPRQTDGAIADGLMANITAARLRTRQ